MDQLDLLNGTGQKNANGATYDDAVATFAKEEALIFPNGIWALPAIKNQSPSFEIDERPDGPPRCGVPVHLT